MLHITTAAEEHIPICVLGPCGRGDEGRTSYSRGWGRLLGLLLQLIEVVSVDNVHLEQLLLLATQQSLHNILLGGHLHPRHESVYGVTVLLRQFRHTAVYCKDIVIVVAWNENYKDEDSEGFLNCAWQAEHDEQKDGAAAAVGMTGF